MSVGTQAIKTQAGLPNGWIWTDLESCADILDSRRVPVNSNDREERISGKSQDELYPYYGATGQVGWIDDYLFDEELVLLGEDGAPFLDSTKGKAYIIKGKTWVNNHAHVLRAIMSITLNSYLRHYLNIFDFHEYVTGTTRLKLNQSRMRKIPLPLPPLPEQHRIVEKIEELFTRLDAGIDSLKKAQAQLKRYRQSVLKAAVEGKLTEEWREAHKGELEPASVLLERVLKERREKWEDEQLEMFDAKGRSPKDDKWKEKYKRPATDASGSPELPEGWEWVTWEQIGFSQNGRAFPSKFYQSSGIKLLRPGNLHESGRVLWTEGNTRYMPENWAIDHPSYVIRGGELVMNLTAQSLRDEFLGRVCITAINERCLLNQRIARLKPILVNTKYLLWLFKSSVFRRFVASLNTGSLIQHMFTSQLAEFALPLPPLAEQHEIVDEVESRLSVADEVEFVIDTELERAERLRQSILKQAFSGKLVPQDPSDEPAAVLLERIKAEKAKREKPAKRAREPEQMELF